MGKKKDHPEPEFEDEAGMCVNESVSGAKGMEHIWPFAMYDCDRTMYWYSQQCEREGCVRTRVWKASTFMDPMPGEFMGYLDFP